MDNIIYFVPVDFSASSYNALHYTTLLAKQSPGLIRICHVIDLEDLSDTENPVTLSFAIDRLFKKAEQRMKSLREIISMDGVRVKEEVLMGNVLHQLLKQIEEVQPTVIVMGRNVEKKWMVKGLVSTITKNTSVPVLVVPESHNPRIPSRVVLASEMKPQRETDFNPLFNSVKDVFQELSILNVNPGFFSNAKEALDWIKGFNSTYGVEAKLENEDNPAGNEISKFIKRNQVDLFCMVKNKTNFFEKIFNKGISNQITDQTDVPFLVIKQ